MGKPCWRKATSLLLEVTEEDVRVCCHQTLLRFVTLQLHPGGSPWMPASEGDEDDGDEG